MQENKYINGATEAGARLAEYAGTTNTEYQQAVNLGITYPASGLPRYEAIAEVLGLEPGMSSSEYITRKPFRGRIVKRQEGCP